MNKEQLHRRKKQVLNTFRENCYLEYRQEYKEFADY